MHSYLFRLVVLAFLFGNLVQAQDRIPPPPCYANGNTGVGGAIGESYFLFSENVNDRMLFNMNLGPGEMNDILVLYVDTGVPGRQVIDASVDDNTDDHRIAITNSNAFGLGSTISFPFDFEASHAIAVNINSAAVYSIPNSGPIGPGGLNFIDSCECSLSANNQQFFELYVDWADLGLTIGDQAKFVGLYVSDTANSSDEGYGDGILTGTSGSDNISFSSWRSLPGCQDTLSYGNNDLDTITAYFLNNELIVKNLDSAFDIKVFDLTGRSVLETNSMQYKSGSIPIDLDTNALHFIVIESQNRRKVLKVIPN